ncbi:MAG: 2Fe-2S iron-sulfur cluster-binding protein [Phycisphaerales bacterium]|nr:2Fe-2S iron-sulfur cluster-binding protein [Phycisphaerales bacterium]
MTGLMPSITINGRPAEFKEGQSILEVALAQEQEIPHYCWHPGLSVVANCRICLAEIWAPNPRNEGKLEPMPKLMPTCQTLAQEGQVVYTDSPKAVANQRSVMELLLINHPVDCPVCDQAGECYLQDYAYRYGRASSRFEEEKIKQPKKDIGLHVLLYGDRCIMCTRCVRFTREVTGTDELMVQGRGAKEEIDVFPGQGLDNELSGNVVDICPVGALLDKDFLFAQRVWFLTRTPSIDGITASGDNISIEHNNGTVFRVKPRANESINKWWISDEIRYGWKFIHDETRHRMPMVRSRDEWPMPQAAEAWTESMAKAVEAIRTGERLALLVSPMLSCEDAWYLGQLALSIDSQAVVGVGPVPFNGQDKSFPGGYTIRAEKAPNARGVRRVLEALGLQVMDAAAMEKTLATDTKIDRLVVTGNYPSQWVTPSLLEAIGPDRFVLQIDTLPNALTTRADVYLPAASWMEKAGTFENADGVLQSFEQAIAPIDYCKSEAQIAMDLQAALASSRPSHFNAAVTRQAMASHAALDRFVSDVSLPKVPQVVESDMSIIEL